MSGDLAQKLLSACTALTLLLCGCSRPGGAPDIAAPAHDELPVIRPLRFDRPGGITLEFRTAADPAFPQGRPIYIGYRARDARDAANGDSTRASGEGSTIRVELRLWNITDEKPRAIPLKAAHQPGGDAHWQDAAKAPAIFGPDRADFDRDLMVAKGIPTRDYDEFAFASTQPLKAPARYRMELRVVEAAPAITGETELLINHPFRYK